MLEKLSKLGSKSPSRPSGNEWMDPAKTDSVLLLPPKTCSFFCSFLRLSPPRILVLTSGPLLAHYHPPSLSGEPLGVPERVGDGYGRRRKPCKEDACVRWRRCLALRKAKPPSQQPKNFWSCGMVENTFCEAWGVSDEAETSWPIILSDKRHGQSKWEREKCSWSSKKEREAARAAVQPRRIQDPDRLLARRSLIDRRRLVWGRVCDPSTLGRVDHPSG